MIAADAEPVSHRFASQGLVLNYLEWGASGVPLAVLLHGSRDHARSWDWTARALLAAGWRVIAPDLRGHGDSQWSPDGAYLTSYHVHDLADLLDAIGEPRFALVGHSFGGTVCMRYAAMFPERVEKLVLIDGFGPGPGNFERWDSQGAVSRSRQWLEARRKTMERAPQALASIEEACEQLRSANPDLTEEQTAHLGRHAVRREGSGWTWKADPQMKHFPPEDYYAETDDIWRAIACPTLAMRGSRTFAEDPFTDGRCKLVRDCRMVTFADTGHWPHHQHFEAFISELLNFLGA